MSRQEAGRKRALVTGGGVRVGRAISLALGAEDWWVAVHYRRSEAQALEVVELLEAAGSGGVALQADLSDPAEISRLIRNVKSELGGLELLVNSAAAFPPHDPLAVSAEEWNALFDLNLRAPFLCAREAAKLMEASGGSIVNLVDTGADEAWPGYVPYVASKAGLVSVTRGLARAFAPSIRVNGVAPGPVLLPPGENSPAHVQAAGARTVLGRVGTPEDIAEAVLYLAGARYVTGEIIRVDGGQHLI